MSTYQQTLTGDSAEGDHLTRQKPAGSPSTLTACAEDNTWWCKDCQNRVTVSYEATEEAAADIDSEYGHDKDCEHSCWER